MAVVQTNTITTNNKHTLVSRTDLIGICVRMILT